MKNSLNFSKDHELIDIAPITEKYMYISTKRGTKQTLVELLLAHSNVLNFETGFLRNHVFFKFKKERLIMVIYDDTIKMLIHICHFYFLGTLKKAEELTNCHRLQFQMIILDLNYHLSKENSTIYFSLGISILPKSLHKASLRELV